jgi:hypothetical protein
MAAEKSGKDVIELLRSMAFTNKTWDLLKACLKKGEVSKKNKPNKSDCH